MDFSTIAGIAAAFLLMILAISSGGGITLFIDPPSAMIVIGGTIGTTLVHYTFKDMMGTVAIIKKAFFAQRFSSTDRIAQIIDYAGKARKEGILSLQSVTKEVDDPFFLKGLQMAVDGQEPDKLKEMLDSEIEYLEERHDRGSEIMVAMGTYAPAMGMIGTLIGLVQMLQTMNDPSSIGPAMAVALLTTFYGAVIANIICMPMSGKLKNRSSDEVLDKTLIAEGMRSILEGENPRVLEHRLHAFVAPKDRQSHFGKKK
ncbi:flagellar basal body stator protein MotA [Syntrophotalea carbinolica DSM 2380]|uniref:Flagellar basal body stator protein MotA n=1 Tax=Syntrophotalea carbinolica (strain DSM 2380 / NBRC 103641 / GraBd1) TaxID=338963 RepID=Q3A5D6_SYNC1|nr:MotA/TolQ/ExbB proton channel family protein [Syntrophotalea carbinolica]ABA88421.1 flagellar basal body stator protein MotA [Syntrophotalea carbinolica DSM 2380]